MKKEDPYFNQKIDCSVKNCLYNDTECQVCNLAKIKICNLKNNDKKENTMCDSFEAKD